MQLNKSSSFYALTCLALTVSIIIFSCKQQSDTSSNLLTTFLLIGQSNMNGWGNPQRINSNSISKRCLYMDRDDTKIDQYHTLQRPTNYKIVQSVFDKFDIPGNQTHGPEYSFIKQMQDFIPEQELLFVKFAQGNSSLLNAWSPTWDMDKAIELKETNKERTQLFDKLIDHIQKANEEAKKQGYHGIDIRGILWIQGEKDCKIRESAKIYDQLLIDFIAALRNQIGDASVPFVALQVNPMDLKFTKLIRKNQKKALTKVQNAKLISTPPKNKNKAFSKYVDDVHYDSNGLNHIGELGAKGLIELLKNNDI